MKPKLASMILAFAAVACAGGGGGGGRGGGGSAGLTDAGGVDPVPGNLPPSFTYEAEGDPEPPIIDEALATAIVLDGATLIATGEEQMLTLDTGFELIIPAGALPQGETVIVRHIDFGDAPPGVTDAVYTFTASAQPSMPVTMTFPIPGDIADLTNHDVYVAWHHQQDLAIALDGVVDEVIGTIQVTTDSFSTGVVTNEGEIPEAPAEADHIIKMPYYNQGSSGNCWSVAGSMLLSGYLDDDDVGRTLVKTWHLNKFFQLSAEHGYSFYPFIYGPDMRTFMTINVPDAVLERHVWFILAEETKLKNYLIGNVLNDEPTMVYVKNPEAHMLLVLGFQKEGSLEQFVIHDPATRAYATISWSEFRDRFSVGGFDQAGTLSLGRPVAPVTHDATIIVPFASERFQGVDAIGKKKNGAFDLGRASVFSWFIEASNTFGFVNLATKQPAPLRKEDLLFMTVEVASNIHPDAEGGMEDKPYQVGFEIFDSFSEEVYADRKSISLMGGESEEVNLVEAPGLDVFIFALFNGVYTVNYFIEDASGIRHDEAEITFEVTDLCGDGICSEEDGEDETSCSTDCDPCGDGVCTPGEVCLIDCHCGNGVCDYALDENDPIDETLENCPVDCHCGDGICDPETFEDTTDFCDADCHCGNGVCNKGLYSLETAEDENNCPEDCDVCTVEVCGFETSLCCGTQCCPEFTLGCNLDYTCGN